LHFTTSKQNNFFEGCQQDGISITQKFIPILLKLLALLKTLYNDVHVRHF